MASLEASCAERTRATSSFWHSRFEREHLLDFDRTRKSMSVLVRQLEGSEKEKEKKSDKTDKPQLDKKDVLISGGIGRQVVCVQLFLHAILSLCSFCVKVHLSLF